MTKKKIHLFRPRTGLMLLLVALAHAQIFLSGTILTRPESGGFIDTILNYTSVLFVDNRARAMFALLFGYGITLVIRSYMKREKSRLDIRRSINRRAIALLFFGFVLSVIIGGKDILAIYGAGLLLVHWFLYRSDKTLVRAMIALTIGFALLLPIFWANMASVGMENMFMTGDGYWETMLNQLVMFFTGAPLFGNFALPVILSIMLGIWFGRKGLLNEDPKHRSLLKKIAFGGILISIVGAIPHALHSNGVITVEQPSLFGIIFTIHMMSGIAGGCGYAALFGLVGPHLKKTNPIVTGITALGKRSLTFFIVNEILLIVLLSPAVFGLASTLSIAQVWVLTFLVWLSSVGMATILELKQKAGPFDFLFRKFVYR